MARKILVTGTAGFIGFHLANELIRRGENVMGIDIINDYYDVNLKLDQLKFAGINKEEIKKNKVVQSDKHSNYRFKQIDLQDREAIQQTFKEEQFDVVVNLAAQAGVRYSIENPHAYVESNIIGFTNILEGCRHQKVKYLVYASSSSVYGLNEKMPLSTSDNVDHPISLYAASKKSNELMAHTYSYLYNLPTTGLRFFSVYGPWGRPDMALFLFTKAILANEPIKVFNHGDMIRDFTYIDDIVEGIIRVINNPPAGSPEWTGMKPEPSKSKAPYHLYNIGNNNPIKLSEFIEAIEEALGREAAKIMLPIQPGDVKATYANVEQLQKQLDYKPETSIKFGIDNFINWYLEYYNIERPSFSKNSGQV